MTSTEPVRLRLAVFGTVQGVGFRPHAWRLATELGLAGFVRNEAAGVLIEVEGPCATVCHFADRLIHEAPAPSQVQEVARSSVRARGVGGFAVVASEQKANSGITALPDRATCADCRADLHRPGGRYEGYAFTTCSACGPRFSILDALPYDRARTAMATFPLCLACRRAYEDPADRRFHAEAQACPVCGPALSLHDPSGARIAKGAAALRGVADRLREGGIVAVKGIGGFHLFTRADNPAAVTALRARKQRPTRPFAVMFPDIAAASAWCAIALDEAALLESAAAPIVLLRRTPGCTAAPAVAPGQPRLGAMLPYAPLHHLLLANLALPLVATSANHSGEPLIFRDSDALSRVADLADAVLLHDRPILRPVEDSVVQIAAGQTIVLRLGRGLAPLAMALAGPAPPLLALGGRLKNAPAVSHGNRVLLAPQLGDLGHPATLAAQRDLIDDLCRMHGVQPQAVVCDAHPDEAAEAARFAPKVIRVQHHLAHVAAAMAEQRLAGPVLGIAWDGAGFGPDGTIWGGEFLRVDGAQWQHHARLRQFRLPGGDAAAREPPRAAVGLLAAMLGADPAAWPAGAVARLHRPDLPALLRLVARPALAPLTSSAGRLFDAIAALLGLCRLNSFEGEAAMALESCASNAAAKGRAYRFAVTDGTVRELDWRPALTSLLDDLAADVPAPEIAARFHRGLVLGAVGIALGAGISDIVLTGGCLQSALLATLMRDALSRAGMRVHLPSVAPPGDGGLALGQIEWARRLMATGDI